MCYVELTLDAGEGLLWFAGCRLFVFLGAAAGPAVCVTRRGLRPGRLCYSALPSARPFVLLGAAFGPAVCATRRCLRPGRLCYSALPSARLRVISFPLRPGRASPTCRPRGAPPPRDGPPRAPPPGPPRAGRRPHPVAN